MWCVQEGNVRSVEGEVCEECEGGVGELREEWGEYEGLWGSVGAELCECGG